MITREQLAADILRESEAERAMRRMIATDVLARTPDDPYSTMALQILDELTQPAAVASPTAEPSTRKRPQGGARASNQYGPAQVHTASDKQLAFFKRLLSERNVRDLPADLRATVEQAADGVPSKRLVSDAIDILLNRAPIAGTDSPVALATPKQVDTINKLADRKEGGALALQVALKARNVTGPDQLSRTDASKLLQILFDAQWKPRTTGPATPLPDGMYRLDGEIYKVQHAVHGSGKQYAKRLTQKPQTFEFTRGFEGGNWTFVYAPGVVHKLRPEHALTIEQAKEFGALYGTCCVCGRTLTDERSIAEGIGPKCAQSFG